ncbi:MAG: HNH endonuclease [Ignavibacteriae bacterium]|nr:HNH endonuclease [Ignavibacteriota bacterium]
MKNENFYKVIPGFPNYFAGKDGRIYSFVYKTYKQLSEIRYPYSKYLMTFIIKDTNRFGLHCHKLVASAFFKINPDRFLIVHKDKDRCNNSPKNLCLTPLSDITDVIELDRFYDIQTKEFEIIFLNQIGFNHSHPSFKKLKEIKEKNNKRLLYNHLKLLVKDYYQ